MDELLATELLRVTAFAAVDAAVDDALARLVTAARSSGGDGGSIEVASILQDSSEVRDVMLAQVQGSTTRWRQHDWTPGSSLCVSAGARC